MLACMKQISGFLLLNSLVYLSALSVDQKSVTLIESATFYLIIIERRIGKILAKSVLLLFQIDNAERIGVILFAKAEGVPYLSVLDSSALGSENVERKLELI